MAASSSSSGAAPSGSPARPSYRSRFGDTTLTKVFVGGLAWETPSEGLRQHFERYGDILEAVVITDRATGRSKGYGFVTFREPEAARQAVQDPNPTIAGRRANCNIASFGPPRPAHPRGAGAGRVSPGGHLQALHQTGPQGPPSFVSRAAPPPQMLPHLGGPAAIYTSHIGYWYQPDFQYQQAMANPQMVQNYYAQPYGLTSPTALPYWYMAPPSPSPRALLPQPAQQVAAQPLLQHPAPLVQGSFLPVPSVSPSVRLQLPHQTMPTLLPASTTTADLPSGDQAASAAGVVSASTAPAAPGA